jgi:hypothetical protein
MTCNDFRVSLRLAVIMLLQKIRDRSSQCASNVLRVLNLSLLESKDRDGSSKKSLNRMLKDVLPCITNAGVGSADVLFAIHVLRSFAPTIHAYLGERATVKIEDKLRSYGEAMMTMDARETAKSWSLFSQFVKCAGAFIRERCPYLNRTHCGMLTG